MHPDNEDSLISEFKPDWESLKQYSVPDWFRDAKFGIFLHWGVQSVPANDGWYARLMYLQENAPWGNAYDYHLTNYGHPSEYGYKDLIPLWKAEKWNPGELVKLFKEIGALYLVPVAVHHDNFDNFDSTWQPWNSVKMGPQRDVVGEWKQAAEQYGLRFGVSSHSDRSWDWFNPSHASDSTGPKKAIPYDGNQTQADGKGKWWEGYDPQELYGHPHPEDAPPATAYCENWYRRTKELIYRYRPDLLYFDGPLPIVRSSPACDEARPYLSQFGLQIAAHFYNKNREWHYGKLEAVLNIKSWGPGTVPDESAIVLDIEKGQSDLLRQFPWQTDTTLIDSWYYTPEKLTLTATVVIHNLCDIVSKNGNLLLNVGLRADGTLPEDQKETLLSIGNWLKLNGAAIYNTRPWVIYGEGPTQVTGGNFKENTQPFTAGDIRFTTRENILYDILLGLPDEKKVHIQALSTDRKLWFGSIKKINMIGMADELIWSQDQNGLHIEIPDQKPCQHAYVLQIEGYNNNKMKGTD